MLDPVYVTKEEWEWYDIVRLSLTGHRSEETYTRNSEEEKQTTRNLNKGLDTEI